MIFVKRFFDDLDCSQWLSCFLFPAKCKQPKLISRTPILINYSWERTKLEFVFLIRVYFSMLCRLFSAEFGARRVPGNVNSIYC